MRSFIFCVGLFSSTSLLADDLISIYQSALIYDKKYAAENIREQVKQEDEKKAKSAFLPHISVVGDSGYSTSNLHFDAASPYFPTLPINVNGAGGLINTSIKLEQVIFDLHAIKRLAAARKLGEAEKIMQKSYQQHLMFRVSKDYFSILSEWDQLQYVKAQIKFYAHQVQAAKDKKQFHRATLLDVDEALTSLELSETARESAKNKLREAMHRLSNDVDKPVFSIGKLRPSIPVQEPTPFHLSQWKKMALKNNVQLHAARIKLEAAKDEIQMQQAKNKPVAFAAVDAAYTRVVDPIFQNFQERSAEAFVGLKIPLVDGGFTKASTTRAIKQYEEDWLTYNQSISDINTAISDVFDDIVTVNEKLKSDKQALITAKQARSGAANAYAVGVEDMSSVLSGEKMYFQARSQARQDLYNYVLLELKLEQLVGSLNTDYLNKVNAYLVNKQITLPLGT
ncbi:MAG: TolC family protein [Gammaproteobacteria bacterium]|nr:TolC family protein [Gammaproteobacteria bacterium]